VINTLNVFENHVKRASKHVYVVVSTCVNVHVRARIHVIIVDTFTRDKHVKRV